jgi:hypothetical protein
VSPLPSHLRGVTSKSLVEGSGVGPPLSGPSELFDVHSRVICLTFRDLVDAMSPDFIAPVVGYLASEQCTDSGTHWGQTVAVMAVPARGAMQLAWIPVRPPSMARVRVKPIMAALAVE